MKKIILTGIRATGIPHIGNYYGAIKPLIDLQEEYRVFQLIADLHAIPHVRDHAVMQNNIRIITACYLACGFDVNQSVLWRQSQIKEMAWVSLVLMSLVTSGELEELMALSQNPTLDMVSCVYPVLMASDTLMLGADLVFAGRDHTHGLEFVRNLAKKFNACYGDILVAPEPIFPNLTNMVQGLDGRKMSKSFDNTISILDSPDVLNEKIMRLNSGDDEASYETILELLSYSVSVEQLEEIKARIQTKNIALSEMKSALFDALNMQLEPIRNRFNDYMKQPEYLDQILADGLIKAEEQAELRMKKILHSAGLSY
ncbi:tryptophanyl-tRNA synthetase [Paenibacillus curdlanolyticus YK9]|uniref:Tryptophan--tRNA ligase n=1 Tax=Paenibacillus curdlanolyticus YK9 TaxID=717606 RepID=E0I5Y2_9BACL|nr:tryptophan--tRNA ligase [Paenibacillus curdlanolyticus]EFM12374.1 tryptophanyl-tRNA synthetase [Paenibacillus curdlanolyticus YK9]